MANGAAAEVSLESIHTQNEELLRKFHSLEQHLLQRVEKIEKDVSEIVENVNSVVKSQEVLNSLFEDQKKELQKNKVTNDNLLKRHTQTRSDLEKANKQINSLQSALEKTQQNLNDLEQYGRRDMITIKGIPRNKDEDTDKIVVDVASLIGVNLSKKQIDVSHRNTQEEDAHIIVKFDSRRSKEAFWSARRNVYDKSISNLGFRGDGKIFINESLTSINGTIFK